MAEPARHAINSWTAAAAGKRRHSRQGTASSEIGRATKGRKGKGVTVITGIPVDDAALKQVAKTLKQKCGSGGTVKAGTIEIQGDHRDVLMAELKGMGYTVRRSGG